MSIMFLTASVVAASQRWRSTSAGTSTACAACGIMGRLCADAQPSRVKVRITTGAPEQTR